MVDLEKLAKSNSIVVFDPECVRKKTNWSKTSNKYKFDDDNFDPEQLRKAIPSQSPKLNALMDKIEALDKADMKRDGHHPCWIAAPHCSLSRVAISLYRTSAAWAH